MAPYELAGTGKRSSAPTLLSLPGDVLVLIASKLDRCEDRLCLEACCRTLLATSRGEHGGTWWDGAKLTMAIFQGGPEQAKQMSDWLAACRPAVPALEVHPSQYSEFEGTFLAPTLPSPPRESILWLCCTLAVTSTVPVCCLTRPPTHPPTLAWCLAVAGLEALRLFALFICPSALEAVRHHTRLTSLIVAQCQFSWQLQAAAAGAQPLCVFSALQDLQLSAALGDFAAPEALPLCDQLAGCSHLTSLSIEESDMRELPPGLSTLSALQRCTFRYIDLHAARRWAELAVLGQLTDLTLGGCRLTAVPMSLSHLTGLCRL